MSHNMQSNGAIGITGVTGTSQWQSVHQAHQHQLVSPVGSYDLTPTGRHWRVAKKSRKKVILTSQLDFRRSISLHKSILHPLYLKTLVRCTLHISNHTHSSHLHHVSSHFVVASTTNAYARQPDVLMIFCTWQI